MLQLVPRVQASRLFTLNSLESQRRLLCSAASATRDAPTRILALESSADDTCAAIVDSHRKIHANVVLRQQDLLGSRSSLCIHSTFWLTYRCRAIWRHPSISCDFASPEEHGRPDSASNLAGIMSNLSLARAEPSRCALNDLASV
jgi:hypothetical protein